MTRYDDQWPDVIDAEERQRAYRLAAFFARVREVRP